MCGIFASVGYSSDSINFESISKALHHRGPDSSGIFHDNKNKISLFHKRLAVIDIDSGFQPIFSGDGSIAVICNGELYDHNRIRDELIEQGYSFKTRSDTEVIINLYLRDGVGMASSLRGEFSFILLDQKLGKLIVCRDRFGIKPLFFYKSPHETGKYLFASEAKAIFASALVKAEIDSLAVRDMLSFVPVDSIFKDIQVVKPGTFMLFDLEKNEVESLSYWNFNLESHADNTVKLSTTEAVHAVENMLTKAVELRLAADVPLGVYLSGGLDSSLIAAIASGLTKDKLKVFSISFTDDSNFDESLHAKAVADHIGADFYKVSCNHEKLIGALEKCLWHTEMPTANLNIVGKYLLSELASKHVTCVLTGEGADELFLGYKYFQSIENGLSSTGISKKDDQLSKPLSKPKPSKSFNSIGFIPQGEMIFTFSRGYQAILNAVLKNLKSSPSLPRAPADRVLARINSINFKSLKNNISKIQYFSLFGIMSPYILSSLGDRQEMANSIEGRVPFLDHHLFHLSCDIAPELKIQDGKEKFILKEIAKNYLNPEIVNREKWPYVAPTIWIGSGQTLEMDRLVATYLSRRKLKNAGIFKAGFVHLLMFIVRTKLFSHNFRMKINAMLTVILSIQVIHQKFVESFDPMQVKR